MILTRKQGRILAELAKVTAAGSLFMWEIKRKLGWKKSQHYTVLRELEDGGLIKRKAHNRACAELAVTAEGREHLKQHLAEYFGPDRKKYKKNWPDKDEPGLSGKPDRRPSARLDDESIRALYRGERYENFRGREIVDNTKPPRPAALEGYGTGVLT